MRKGFIAIAAMSQNRVIGRDNKLPWHLPDELKWFKRTTTGHVLVMGRKTFESIGRPLPNRETIVLSRTGFSFPGVKVLPSLEAIDPASDPRHHFIIGGEQVFRAGLPLCSELYLTLVKRDVEGDTWFPEFEHLFGQPEIILDQPDFEIRHYRRLIPGADKPLSENTL
jgi:dihydrofolate reductase